MIKHPASACGIAARKNRFAPTDGPNPSEEVRASPGKRHSLSQVKRGEGKIITIDGKNVAAFRDEAGLLSLRAVMANDLHPSEKTG
jgi:hypothetical protein